VLLDKEADRTLWHLALEL